MVTIVAGVVAVAVVGLVDRAVDVLVTDAGVFMDVVRDVDVLGVDEDWLNVKVLDIVSATVILLSSLDISAFGTKIRGIGGTNATLLDSGAPYPYIVLVTMIVVVIVLVAGMQAPAGCSCGGQPAPLRFEFAPIAAGAYWHETIGTACMYSGTTCSPAAGAGTDGLRRAMVV